MHTYSMIHLQANPEKLENFVHSPPDARSHTVLYGLFNGLTQRKPWENEGGIGAQQHCNKRKIENGNVVTIGMHRRMQNQTGYLPRMHT